MNIQFVYFGKRGGGVNDIISLLNSIELNDFNIYSLNNIRIRYNTLSVNEDIHFDYLNLPNSIKELFLYLLSLKWFKIFSILNNNKAEHIIITMFHPLNIFIYLYKFLFFKRVKIYYFLHNDNKIQTFNFVIDKLIRTFDHLFCLLANKIFILSDNVYHYASRHFILKFKKINLIGFGVYYKHDAISHQLEFYNSNPLTFIFFGKILPYKGLDVLFKALQLLNDEDFNYRCYIIGEGDLHYNNFSENIIVINEWVSDTILVNHINKSHFSIFPYKFCSQSGALSTAISNNIPVLVSNIPVLSQYVNKNDLGFVITNLNAENIATSIKEINANRNQLFSIHYNIIKYNKNNNTWKEVWSKINKNLL
jgi:glycosyltransferase involved in cell wall biosynthesis